MKFNAFFLVAIAVAFAAMFSSCNSGNAHDKALQDTVKIDNPFGNLIEVDLNNDNVKEQFIAYVRNSNGVAQYNLWTKKDNEWIQINDSAINMVSYIPEAMKESNEGWKNFSILLPDGGFPVYIYAYKNGKYSLEKIDRSGDDEGTYTGEDENGSNENVKYEPFTNEIGTSQYLAGVWKNVTDNSIVKISFEMGDQDNMLVDNNSAKLTETLNGKTKSFNFYLTNNCDAQSAPWQFTEVYKKLVMTDGSSSVCINLTGYSCETKLKVVLKQQNGKEIVLTRDTKDQ